MVYNAETAKLIKKAEYLRQALGNIMLAEDELPNYRKKEIKSIKHRLDKLIEEIDNRIEKTKGIRTIGGRVDIL